MRSSWPNQSCWTLWKHSCFNKSFINIRIILNILINCLPINFKCHCPWSNWWFQSTDLFLLELRFRCYSTLHSLCFLSRSNLLFFIFQSCKSFIEILYTIDTSKSFVFISSCYSNQRNTKNMMTWINIRLYIQKWIRIVTSWTYFFVLTLLFLFDICKSWWFTKRWKLSPNNVF